jgi:hypothetical protein
MNDKNYEYLTEQLKRTGFGDTLNDELRNSMEKQNAEFTLNMQKTYGTDAVSATLQFKKSDQFDMYFFNSYEMKLKKEGQENDVKQTFYTDKGITLKEAYNMLDGRAVNKMLLNKESEKYKAWLQLDFKNNTQSGNYQIKQYHQNYGYDLEKTLSKYPIKELQNEKFKESLIKSLERGNLQSTTFLINGKEEKIYLSSNPAFKSLNAFDADMQKIKLSDVIQSQKQEQSNKQENKQSVSEKQGAKKETTIRNENPTQKKSKTQKVV